MGGIVDKVPEGWVAKRIGELGSTYPGLSGKTKDDFGAGKPFVTYTQVFKGGRIELSACDSVAVDADERQHRVRFGDVLFTTSSETAEEIAYSAVVLDEVPELYLNSFCFGFRPTSPDELSPEFSSHLFRGPEFRRAAVQLGQGSTRFNISKNRVMDIVLALPPHCEQRKIAAILSSVDDAIAATRKVIEQTKRVKQGLLQTLMTRGIGHTRFKKTEIGEIPESWDVVRLDEVASRGSGHTPSKRFPEYWNGNIKWVSLSDSDALDQVYLSKTEKTVTLEGIANSSAVIHPVGTVFVSRDASVGRSAIAECEMAVSQHFIAWQCGGRLNNHFLYYFLQYHKPKFH